MDKRKYQELKARYADIILEMQRIDKESILSYEKLKLQKHMIEKELEEAVK